MTPIETSTATIKMTRQEITTVINTLDFICTINLPIDNEFLKPYEKLKTDLMKIEKQLIDGEQQTR